MGLLIISALFLKSKIDYYWQGIVNALFQVDREWINGHSARKDGRVYILVGTRVNRYDTIVQFHYQITHNVLFRYFLLLSFWLKL